MARKESGKKVDGRLIIKRVKELATCGGDLKIAVSPHAAKRMKEREINLVQVYRVLRGNFSIYENPFPSAKGDWEMTVEGGVAGDVIRVGIALKERQAGEFLLVITVVRPGKRKR